MPHCVTSSVRLACDCAGHSRGHFQASAVTRFRDGRWQIHACPFIHLWTYCAWICV